jgi:hypothetical protein
MDHLELKLMVRRYLEGIWVVIWTGYRVIASCKAYGERIAASWQLGKVRKARWHFHSFWVSQKKKS